MADRTEPRWRRSSRSMGNGGNCVEVADSGDVVHVRDSKNPDGPVVGLGAQPWRAFLTALAADRAPADRAAADRAAADRAAAGPPGRGRPTGPGQAGRPSPGPAAPPRPAK
ncbi:DUF397 domain-containing protein [Streptomyces sp. NPDC004065]|uniref:DUF397 domain-containing protein n=1 Tax=Streptomyces sp. NPDC004065 TaxID=3364689 RepID=UPI00384EFC46